PFMHRLVNTWKYSLTLKRDVCHVILPDENWEYHDLSQHETPVSHVELSVIAVTNFIYCSYDLLAIFLGAYESLFEKREMRGWKIIANLSRLDEKATSKS